MLVARSESPLERPSQTERHPAGPMPLGRRSVTRPRLIPCAGAETLATPPTNIVDVADGHELGGGNRRWWCRPIR